MSAPWREAWASGTRAVAANRRPFVLVQGAAAGLVVLYYTLPGARVATQSLADIKEAGGLVFSGVTTAIAGAVLPEIAKRITKTSTGKMDGLDLAFQFAFFATLGMIVDLLYREMAVIFGAEVHPIVVLKKVLVDQLVFSPLISIPFSTAAFLWKDSGFSWRQSAVAVREGVWSSRYLSLLVMCWAFWIPTLACVYAMPLPLQFCLFLCADVAWCLILLSMSGR